MDSFDPYLSLAVAIASGLLIGLEREQSRDGDQERGTFLGGARTYALFAGVGGVSSMLAQAFTAWIMVAAFLAVAALAAISYLDDVKSGRDRGLTTEASLLLTFLLGALAPANQIIASTTQRVMLVASLAVVTTFLLSAKPWLAPLIQRVSRDDLYATIKFLIVAIIVLPLLPNQTYGPLDVLNPFSIGLMIVLIAGLGFAGFVANRVLGAGRGFAVTALLGGLVSSTAVTLSFSARAKESPALARAAAVAIVLASTIMFPRVLVEVAAVHRPLLSLLWIPFGAMTVAGLVACALLYLRARGKEKTGPSPEVALSNPFELGSAVRFGLIFAVVIFVSKAAQIYAGAAGMYAAAALAGTTDVDAITLSTAKLAQGGLSPATAVNTIMIGAVANTAVKAGLATVLGGWHLGRIVIAALAFVIAAGGAALLFV
jgi:uncharacterized membrane protein (DUF4010 family)